MRPSNEHPGTKEHHSYSREEGYKPAEYQHAEYPKQVGTAEHGEPILAHNPEEEAALTADDNAE